jgi:hypothetical protein
MLQWRYARVLSLAVCAPALIAQASGDGRQTASISGRITTPDGRQLLSGAIAIVAADDASAQVIEPELVRIFPGGQFTVGGVPPGRYQIRARGVTEHDGRTLFARFDLAVEYRDVSNIQMALQPGIVLDGTVSIERARGSAPVRLDLLTVRTPLTDGSGFGDALTGRVGRGGSFVVNGVIGGAHHLLVEGLPEGWTVKQVLLRGRDVTDQSFDVDETRSIRGVRVVVSDRVSQVAGRVRDAGAPARDARVIVFSVSPSFWIPGSRRLCFLTADGDGRFLLKGLPPGAYLAAALMSFDGTRIAPALLERLRDAATRFSVTSDDDHVVIDLQLSRVEQAP